MGILQIHKRIQQEKQKDFEKRAKSFVIAYKELTRKYECDWQCLLHGSENGIVPKMQLIDVKEQIEKERNEKNKNK